MKRHRHRAGLSVPELLIVIAVAASLLALLLAGGGAVRRKAQTAQCAANLRQLGTILTLYINEHGRALPPYQMVGPAGTADQQLWFHWLLPYVSEGDWRISGTYWNTPDPPGRELALLRCPSQKDPFILNYRIRYGINATHASYINRANPEASRILKITSLREPSLAIVIADSMDATSDGVSFSSSPSVARGFLIQNNLTQPVSDRHHGGANVLFADGHLEWFRFYDLTAHPSDTPATRKRKLERWDQRL